MHRFGNIAKARKLYRPRYVAVADHLCNAVLHSNQDTLKTFFVFPDEFPLRTMDSPPPGSRIDSLHFADSNEVALPKDCTEISEQVVSSKSLDMRSFSNAEVSKNSQFFDNNGSRTFTGKFVWKWQH